MSRGLYLVLEGGDATGKSMQATALVAWLRQQGSCRVLHPREPGSTATGEALRGLLLDPSTGDLEPLTEALLFAAARVEMLRQEVRPALEDGRVVVAERCYLSTLVYQGLASEAGVSTALLNQITEAVHADLWPERIFLLDVDDDTRRARADGAGKADRFEARDEGFHRAVRKAYLALAESDGRVEVVDARPPFDEVQTDLRRRVSVLLSEVQS